MHHDGGNAARVEDDAPRHPMEPSERRDEISSKDSHAVDIGNCMLYINYYIPKYAFLGETTEPDPAASTGA